jgi:hypothetical protein
MGKFGIIGARIISEELLRFVNALVRHGHAQTALPAKSVKAIVHLSTGLHDHTAKFFVRSPKLVKGHELFHVPQLPRVDGMDADDSNEKQHPTGRPMAAGQKPVRPNVNGDFFNPIFGADILTPKNWADGGLSGQFRMPKHRETAELSIIPSP